VSQFWIVAGSILKRKTLEILGYCPEVTKKCRYELDGKVMLMPVKGKGDSTIVLSECLVLFQVRGLVVCFRKSGSGSVIKF
jgi:hypothetical protein